ncbi:MULTISPECIES: hypothetical protein [Marinobacter]|uniref:hypothetical protein n=1 Tax=Marinobacter TaxID=2742 RepID=UPI000718E974|nr:MULTISPECIES: hypothetical protein [Marinobacter]AMQ89200.1 hypothetical protein ASQ50_11115 [Marinobacter sp. LQ44]
MKFIKESLVQQKIRNGTIRIYQINVDLDTRTEDVGGHKRDLPAHEIEAYQRVDMRDCYDDMRGFCETKVYAIFDKGVDTKIRFSWGRHMDGMANSTSSHIVRLDSGFSFWSDMSNKVVQTVDDVAAFILARPECWRADRI